MLDDVRARGILPEEVLVHNVMVMREEELHRIAPSPKVDTTIRQSTSLKRSLESSILDVPLVERSLSLRSEVAILIPLDLKILAIFVNLSVNILRIIPVLHEAIADDPAEPLELGIPGALLPLVPTHSRVQSSEAPDGTGSIRALRIDVSEEPSGDHRPNAVNTLSPDSRGMIVSVGVKSFLHVLLKHMELIEQPSHKSMGLARLVLGTTLTSGAGPKILNLII